MKIVEHGVVCIPLYHGTSSVFLPSIKDAGLGGANPIADYDATSFLQTILATCEEELADDADWRAVAYVPRWIVAQESFSGGGDFQHGETYLTPSHASAQAYALTNRFGSEFITMASRLWELLKTRRPGCLENLGLDGHPMLSLFNRDHRPVIVRAERIPVGAVSAEGGSDPDGAIKELEELSEFLAQPGFVLNINFRLRAPIPGDFLTIELVGPNANNPYDW